MYPKGGSLGAEILVECEHMMCSLTKNNHMSEKDALKRIQHYLPKTGALYAQYLDMETKLLDEIERIKRQEHTHYDSDRLLPGTIKRQFFGRRCTE